MIQQYLIDHRLKPHASSAPPKKIGWRMKSTECTIRHQTHALSCLCWLEMRCPDHRANSKSIHYHHYHHHHHHHTDSFGQTFLSHRPPRSPPLPHTLAEPQPPRPADTSPRKVGLLLLMVRDTRDRLMGALWVVIDRLARHVALALIVSLLRTPAASLITHHHQHQSTHPHQHQSTHPHQHQPTHPRPGVVQPMGATLLCSQGGHLDFLQR